MFRRTVFILLFSTLMTPLNGNASEPLISEATGECIECHSITHPGIVEGWRNSRHAMMTPKAAAAEPELKRKVSYPDIPERLKSTVVGCAECHTLNPEIHTDTFEHNGYDVHVVVTPNDCQICHLKERTEYAKNIMAMARKNLDENPLYEKLQQSISGAPVLGKSGIEFQPPGSQVKAVTCFHCHGTELKVTGTETRETDLAGELEFPVIDGWPNQGVGRVNPDGSRGACTACHTRHGFSIEMARKPHTCKSCHVGPDVPAFKIYSASKHGNIYSAHGDEWNFNKVPWTIGEDFKAPTCAACHVSLLTNTDGDVVAQRTHQMSDRLSWRIFGLPYAHPQPKSPDTSIIRNKEGQPLPTDMDGGMASDYLIDAKTQLARTATMKGICNNCHDASWTEGHFRRYRHIIDTTNDAVKTASTLMQQIWEQGGAKGLPQQMNPFDEAIEKKWTDTWLFYANSIRFTAAMGGGGDYAVFADGSYQLSRNITELYDRMVMLSEIRQLKSQAEPKP